MSDEEEVYQFELVMFVRSVHKDRAELIVDRVMQKVARALPHGIWIRKKKVLESLHVHTTKDNKSAT